MSGLEECKGLVIPSGHDSEVITLTCATHNRDVAEWNLWLGHRPSGAAPFEGWAVPFAEIQRQWASHLKWATTSTGLKPPPKESDDAT